MSLLKGRDIWSEKECSNDQVCAKQLDFYLEEENCSKLQDSNDQLRPDKPQLWKWNNVLWRQLSLWLSMTIGKPLAQWLALSQAVLLNTGKTQSEIDPALLFPVAFGVCHCTHATTEQMEFASITWKCGADKRFLNYPCLSSRVGAAPSEGKQLRTLNCCLWYWDLIQKQSRWSWVTACQLFVVCIAKKLVDW